MSSMAEQSHAPSVAGPDTPPVRRLLTALRSDVGGGAVMLLAAAAALIWANSPLGGAYERLWATDLSLGGHSVVHLDLPLRLWVNDALMTVFFFVVGLEIKRELAVGELREPRAAALPAVAAVGGMVVPAAIYAALNHATPAAGGWGIPMATDIAFALAVVALLGRRVAPGAKLFLLALAVADDVGAIGVIAVFYTAHLSLGWLAAAVATVGAAVAARWAGVRAVAVYVALGAACWYALHESGVHATLAGVAFGLLTPAQGGADEHGSPLERIEHRVAPWSALAVVPLFALANAGVAVGGSSLSGLATDRVVLGVALGLLAGKTAGILGATWVAVRLGVGQLPAGTGWRQVTGLAVLAGMGFTVALFVAELAFTDPALVASAKVGILGASTVAAVAGYLLLRLGAPHPVRTGATGG